MLPQSFQTGKERIRSTKQTKQFSHLVNKEEITNLLVEEVSGLCKKKISSNGANNECFFYAGKK
jgi:hypothetical protein